MKGLVTTAFYGLLVLLTLGYIARQYHEELRTSTPEEILHARWKQIIITIPMALLVWLLLPSHAPFLALLIAWAIVFIVFILRYRWHVASFKDGTHPWFNVKQSPEVQRKLREQPQQLLRHI